MSAFALGAHLLSKAVHSTARPLYPLLYPVRAVHDVASSAQALYLCGSSLSSGSISSPSLYPRHRHSLPCTCRNNTIVTRSPRNTQCMHHVMHVIMHTGMRYTRLLQDEPSRHEWCFARHRLPHASARPAHRGDRAARRGKHPCGVCLSGQKQWNRRLKGGSSTPGSHWVQPL